MIAPRLLASSLLLLNGVMAMEYGAGSSTGDSAADSAADPVSQVQSSDSSMGSSGGSIQGPGGNMVNIQVVKVSNKDADLIYDPEEIQAEPGSMVQFQFYPKAHTLTQSTFDRPCEPINQAMPNVTGISSGPMPPENGMMKVFTMMVNDTAPLWMYCATGDHCQKGMSMVINPPESTEKTLSAYKAASAQASTSNSTGSDASNNLNESADDASASEDAESLPSAANPMVKSMAGAAGLTAILATAFAAFL